nr:MAG TPA: hypothetical protein [Caudoviricetes sp.]
MWACRHIFRSHCVEIWSGFFRAVINSSVHG